MIFGARSMRISFRMILLRYALAVLLLFLLIKSRNQLAVFFFTIAALLSFMEGFMRRKMPYRTQGRLVLDAVADKLLVNVASITLAVEGIIPFWVPAVFLLRDFLTLVGAAIMLARNAQTEFKPTLTGKMALFFQVVALLPAIFHNPDTTLLLIAAAATAVATVEAFFTSEFRKVRRKRDRPHYSFFAIIKFADIVSLLNGVFGMVSILFALNGQYAFAAWSMLAAVLADFLDGKVARWLGQQHEFGREIDSLADTISFGVAPAVFAFTLIQTKLAVISLTIFVFCGILRLARYNIMSAPGQKAEDFIGMPITMNGVIIPSIYFLGLDPVFYPYLYLILGFLMVSSIRIRKI